MPGCLQSKIWHSSSTPNESRLNTRRTSSRNGSPPKGWLAGFEPFGAGVRVAGHGREI